MTRAPWLLLFLAAIAGRAPIALADGGEVQLRQESGPFLITLFAAPAPLRAGPVDVSVMVQDRTSLEPVLDAEVSLRVWAEGGEETSAHLTRANAQNKLLYAAPIEISKPGTWNATVAVNRAASRCVVQGKLHAASTDGLDAGNWVYVVLAPVFIAVFALREWLVRRRATRTSYVQI